jgi:hypothetical protein
MRFLAALGLVLVLGVGLTPEHAQCFHEPHAQPLRFGVRAQDDPRPWMRGTIEVGCNRTGVQPKGDTSTEFKACSCHHREKAGGSCEDETQGRAWDPSCSTRCSPRRCTCEPNKRCSTE